MIGNPHARTPPAPQPVAASRCVVYQNIMATLWMLRPAHRARGRGSVPIQSKPAPATDSGHSPKWQKGGGNAPAAVRSSDEFPQAELDPKPPIVSLDA